MYQIGTKLNLLGALFFGLDALCKGLNTGFDDECIHKIVLLDFSKLFPQQILQKTLIHLVKRSFFGAVYIKNGEECLVLVEYGNDNFGTRVGVAGDVFGTFYQGVRIGHHLRDTRTRSFATNSPIKINV